MRLCRFARDGEPALGAVVDGQVLDLSAAAPDLPAEPAAALDAAGGVEALAEVAAGAEERWPLEDIRLLAPVRPRKYLAIALNYADHIAETGLEAPRCPPSSTSR